MLIGVLNSAPVVEGNPTDALRAPGATEWLRGFGGHGTQEECERVRQVRDALHPLVRGTSRNVDILDSVLYTARRRPVVSPAGVSWQLETAAEEELAVRLVLAWSHITTELPGRLRPCANEECNLFLVDRSRPGTARWCSMAACGNRMKARTHARKRRSEQ
nr:CGNR zinc finger domain-containing protein [Streptomyces spiramenti]